MPGGGARGSAARLIEHRVGTQACLSCPRHKGQGYRRAVGRSKRPLPHTVPVAIRGVRTASTAVIGVLVGVLVGLVLPSLGPSVKDRDRRTTAQRKTTVNAAPASVLDMTPCERLALSRQKRLVFTSGTGPRILVIGDSWSTGAKLPPGGRDWSELLPGEVRVDGVPGSGFSESALGCPGLSYGDRAASSVRQAQPRLVVVQGGLNDTDAPVAEVRRGFYRLALALGDADVVVVGPTLAPKRADEVPAVDELLSGLSQAAGFTYISTTDLELKYLGDGLHLTQRGHRLLGEAVAARVAEHLSEG